MPSDRARADRRAATRSIRLSRPGLGLLLALCLLGLGPVPARAGEPDPGTYWRVEDLRTGMKGVGRTVMVGTTLEDFDVEVLGVMRGVSPGRDMILCRLKGLNLEHAGIIQGMSGSPIYIEGKLVGAVAFAWEFGKDPIAGVTPFEQMVAYVRASDRRLAAERGSQAAHAALTDPAGAPIGVSVRVAQLDRALFADRDAVPPPPLAAGAEGPLAVSGGGLAGMRPIATPLAATGFTPRALSLLTDRLGPLGLAPMAGGGVTEEILAKEGDTPLRPGSPVSVAMVTGDFDLSGIGTVTHVEGDRVYAFGHPLMSLGACELPMMNGYIHTVYPRTSVSMKLGSPLKVVGVLDTDVSTAVSGRLGAVPDLMPMAVTVQTGRFAEPRTYRVQIAREPNLLPTMVLTVLTNAIDTEGNLPAELTARMTVTVRLKGHEPIRLVETLSGPRFAGPSGPQALFGPVAATVSLLVRNGLEPVRIEGIDAQVQIEDTQRTAAIESIRLASDQVEPGQALRATVTLKPYLGERQSVAVELPLPADLPEGTYEASVLDVGKSLQRRVRNDPTLLQTYDLAGLIRAIQARAQPTRTALYLHVPGPGRGLSVAGQSLPELPGGVRAVFGSSRQTAETAVRADLIAVRETPWVLEGGESVKFTVSRHPGVTAIPAQ